MGSLKNEEMMTGGGGEDKSTTDEEAVLCVNGVRRVLPDGLAHLTLLEYLKGTS